MIFHVLPVRGLSSSEGASTPFKGLPATRKPLATSLSDYIHVIKKLEMVIVLG